MAWGPVDYHCGRGCGAMFADRRERNSHEDDCMLLEVYGTDTDVFWTVLETYDPEEALRVLREQREKEPHHHFEVIESGNEENGSVESLLDGVYGTDEEE